MPIAATLCLLLIGANVVGLLTLSGNWPPAFITTQSQISITGPGSVTPTPIHATVLGAVYVPGLYTLQDGAHVSDLIEAGGGALTTADLSHIDLSAALHDGTDAMTQSQSTEQVDFRQLDDPDFLAERRRVREELERAPERSPGQARLAARYAEMSAEFDRRASLAWTGAS